MRVYILTMNAANSTHSITRVISPNAYKVREKARTELAETAEMYNQLEGYTLTAQTPDFIQYRVRNTGEPYMLTLEVGILEIV